jgi:hypothetical protein
MAKTKSLLRRLNTRWAIVALGLLLSSPAAFGAWGYSWLYVSSATVDGGAISEGDYWDCYEFAGCAISVDVDVMGPGTYLGHRSAVDYWGYFAQANFFSWTSGYGWYSLNASHNRQNPDYWNSWITFATTQASTYLENPNPIIPPTIAPDLDALQNDGLISWSYDGSTVTVSFVAEAVAWPTAIEVCAAAPVPCVVVGGIAVIYVGYQVATLVAPWIIEQARRLMTVRANCYIHPNGSENHEAVGSVSGQGQGLTWSAAQASAYSAATAALLQRYPLGGYHLQHCDYVRIN